jgi:hypothetical protein
MTVDHKTRWRKPRLILAAMLIFAGMAVRAQDEINWSRARQIVLKIRTGQKLTGEENEYLERVRQGVAAIRLPASGEIDWSIVPRLNIKTQLGIALTPEEKSYLDNAERSRERGGAKGGEDSVGLIPLTDIGSTAYKGESGGLYGEGNNEPPAAHQAAALMEAARIRPLDAQGTPSAGGKSVLLSIGMSNTTQEFAVFKELADRDPQKSPSLVIVNGAQGSQAALEWTTRDSINHVLNKPVWGIADEHLAEAGVTPKQVQVVWIKQALIQEGQYGEFPAHARKLEEAMLKILQLAKERYPNLRLAYLSSRIYGGYATTTLNPEPYAYEGAFAMRWVIQRQINGDPGLNYDPKRGAIKAPLVLWGPYLWADGLKPRKSGGVVWAREDLSPHDGTHPSRPGREKVARLLLEFLKTNATAKSWFVGSAQH